MDIRSADCPPIIEHEDVVVHSMVPKFTMREETRGGYLEFIDVFEIAPGAKAEPHYHDTDEFYFMLEGEAGMQIEEEARKLGPGDLVRIPPNAPHSIWPLGDSPIRAFCFAVSYQEPFEPGYVPCDLPEVPLSED